MNALFDEQNSGVDYALEAIIPKLAFEGIEIRHEGLMLEKIREMMEEIGGKVNGDDIRLTDKTSIDHKQFEANEKEEKNA